MTDEPKIIPADIQAMNSDALIAEHRKIADHVKVQADAFAAFCKPYRERQEFIENRLLAMLVQMNSGKPEGKRASIATEHGTAYLSTIVTPKVINKEEYLDWVLEDWDHRGDMLQIGAPQKDAFNAYLDQYQQNPPHIEISSFTRVNIRRS